MRRHKALMHRLIPPEFDTSCTATMGLSFVRVFDLTEYAFGKARFLGPAGWTEVEEGVFSDLKNSLLLVNIVEGRVAAERLEEFLNEIADALNSGAAELVSQQRQFLGNYEWDITQVNLKDAGFGLVLAGAQSDTFLIPRPNVCDGCRRAARRAADADAAKLRRR